MSQTDTRPTDQATTPGKTFVALGVEQVLADALADKGITHAFPIQELTLPMAIGGADIIGQARTGTGKTLGFGLPLLSRIDTGLAKTQALVVVPTRELCIQVADDLAVGAARGVTVQSVYGGVPYEEQIEALTGGVHVVVGTPGRTLDHLEKRNLDLSNVHVVVLDEADEMLDMGFLPDVERLLRACPEQRQTLLFSATMPKEVVKLARRFMATPTFMQADTEAHETAPNVDQYFFLVHRMDKPRVLARLMQSPNRGGAFVFCRTKRMCDRLVDELEELGVTAIAVHGDKRQASREKNLDKFRAGKADVLVATEVAARGLDVDNVTHVVNYDCPDDEKMYLHRIGRTARAGEAGVAVTFAELNEADRANVIRKKVDADTEMMEIFSTSDELTSLFDLPAETPWAHLSKKKTGGKPRAKSSGDTRSKRGDANRGSTRSSSKPERTKKAEDTAARDNRSRTRTRTRTRTVTADERGGDDKGRDRSNDASGGARSRDRRQTSSSSSKDQSKDGRSNNRSSNNNRGGNRQSNRNSNNDRSGNRRGGQNDRSGTNRSNDNSRGGNQRSRARTTRRGDEARGEGTPRHDRKVEVEHLP